MNRHSSCPGEGCGVCAARIDERELRALTGEPYPTTLSIQRADGSWRRGADWHRPADMQRVGGGL